MVALTTGILATFLGLYQAFIAVQLAGSVPMGVMCGGLKVASIPTMYGMIIFLVSLVIRIVQKPRI
jgi:biopolymer transport protein ExbB/TolQ